MVSTENKIEGMIANRKATTKWVKFLEDLYLVKLATIKFL